MESKDSESNASRSLRRSTRQSSSKALGFEPTPRGPLKRTKRSSGRPGPAAAVNGSGDQENGSEDEESPGKKRRLETEGPTGCDDDGGDDGTEMDVQESAGDMKNNQEQETVAYNQESSRGTRPPKLYQDSIGDVNLHPRVVLHEYRRPQVASGEADLIETKRVNSSTKGPAAPTKSAVQHKSLVNSHDVPTTTTSMAEYKNRMEAIAKTAAIPTVNNVSPGFYPSSEKSMSVHQRLRDIPIQKESVKPKKKAGKKKTEVIKKSSRNSSRGCMWYFWCLVGLLLLGTVAFLAFKKFPVLRMVAELKGHISRVDEPDVFADQLSLLEAQFPSQRPELWKRSMIHLGKHLRTAQPTEPVSLIFTAGHSAERTLHCLAQGLASAFSSVNKTSVLQIDGASKAIQDSDEVKLVIDSQLKEAFEGDKPVAIIHRFEELPPSSTLIFYRYCDHENAAYKQVFLLFTVLLPQDEVSSEHSLKDVDEMVQDYLRERLVGSSNQTSFNEMDNNKYGGLWSRISHLVLPVVSEKEVEKRGCS
ncbi:torsin-1A-interacting protein 2 isoform X1 [Pleuronectes platessa]|uniref:torsin-1A-interacting protein 2 isoform X1 n=1 Tax=Pleuronectes platessa TaxID=8262 RepID=UPI00232A0983|nr:torsin-1A-interacting protein 2 isoform X1 [Pleuronectes platessa]